MTTQYRFTARSATLLSKEFEEALNAGLLRPGERLPSVRAMAAQLGVSPSTISAAFTELRRRGLIVTRNRGASWVNPRPPVAGGVAPMIVPPGVVDLATGNPDPSLLPPLAPAVCEAVRDAPMRLYGTDDAPDRLAGAVAAELVDAARSERLLVPAQTGCVVVSGAMDGIERALGSMLSRPSKVGIEDPGYDTLAGLVRALGHEPLPVPVDADGPVAEGVSQAIEAGAAAVVVTCRGQNPTGSAVSAQRAVEIRDVLAARPDVAVVENDHLGSVSGAALHSVAGHTERWAYVRSFAKTLGPDLRLAVLVSDQLTAERVRGRLALGPGWVSEILQRTVLAMLEDPGTAAVLEKAQAAYSTRRRLLADELAAVGVSVSAGTGFNLWLPVDDETAMVMGLLRHGWAVAPGARYRLASGSGIRVTATSLTPPQTREFAQAVASVMRPVPGRSA